MVRFFAAVSRARAAARVVAIILLLLGIFGGCARDPLPGLIDLYGISAQTIEPSSDWSLHGRGFPPRRPAQLTLSGRVFAPGQKPASVTLRFARTSESRSRISLALSDEELAPLWNGAAHVTFRGDLRVEFAPVRPGGPPLAATLEGLSFDAHRRGASRSPSTEVSAFLAHIGLEVSSVLAVTGVQVGGRAEAAGLAVGDELLELDDVRLTSLSDLVPRPGQELAVFKVTRSNGREPLALLVDRRGYSRGGTTFAHPSLLGLLAATLALLVSLRPPRPIGWMLAGIPRRGQPGASHPRNLRAGILIPLGITLLLEHSLFRWSKLTGFTADAALLMLVGVLLACTGLLGACSDATASGRVVSGARGVGTAVLFVLSVFLSSAVGFAHAGGLSFLTEATLLGGPPRLIATQSPWLLLSGLGLLFTLALAASVLARATKSRGILGRLGLVVLASFWVRLFFGRFAQVGTPLELFIVGCLTAFVLELMTWFATKAPPNAVPRLLGFVTVGASLPGACLFALTIPWSSARSLGGLELATSLFFLVCLGLLAYVRARAGYRVVRPVDPWI